MIQTVNMRFHITIAALALAALACGATVPPSDALPFVVPTATPTPTASGSQMTYISRPVHGCWNLRQSPGLDGMIVDVVCNGAVIVKQFDNGAGWYETADGLWIYGEAFAP